MCAGCLGASSASLHQSSWWNSSDLGQLPIYYFMLMTYMSLLPTPMLQAEALTSQTLLHAPGAAAATSVKPIVACDRDTQKTAPAAVKDARDALTTGASQEPSHWYSILTVLATAAVTAIVATAVASGMDDVVVEVLRLLALVQL